MYQLTQTETILRISDGASIPPDPANSDYAAYLAWRDGYTETIRAPGIWTPEIPATFDSEGNELTPLIPGFFTEGEVLEVIEHPPHTPDPYVKPPPPIPSELSMAQTRGVLHELGKLELVESAMATMPKAAQIRWEFESKVKREDPLVQALIALLELSSEEVDNMFLLGDSL